tara:strand:- start:568 stop:819 length:252 start_codon:yes stop_codon:yes gene_type:complete
MNILNNKKDTKEYLKKHTTTESKLFKQEEKPVKNILKEYKEEMICLQKEVKFYRLFAEYVKKYEKETFNEAFLYADYKTNPIK